MPLLTVGGRRAPAQRLLGMLELEEAHVVGEVRKAARKKAVERSDDNARLQTGRTTH
jgi:hypothetical protein